MSEVFPVLAGVVLGLVIQSVRSTRMRVIAVAACGPTLGAIASWAGGELAISWVHVLIDVIQVLAVAVMTAVAVHGWRRRGYWHAS